MGVFAGEAPIPALPAAGGGVTGSAVLGHGQIAEFGRTLAAASPRVLYRVHGQSSEGRELFHLVVSDPARLARLPDGGGGQAVRREESPPVIVWLGGAIHGDEHSSSEALLLAARHLAAATDDATADLLRRVVVIFEPLQNPDGRERFRRHLEMAQFGSPNPDPEAWEHNQDWPGGRGNHFYFDLNRDWFFMTQPETRARVKTFLAWRPHVFADLHEMGGDSTYFFAPPAMPVHRRVLPSTRRWWDEFGQALAADFDQRGVTFFRREVFDLFYPGYGDSWPTFQGAVGMTFEQASVRGATRRRNDRRVMTVAQAVDNHLAAALVTIDHAAARREALLQDHSAATGSVDALVVFLPPSVHSGRLGRMAEKLAAQGIPMEQLARETRVRRLHDYRGGPAKTLTLPAGTRVIRGQGAGALLASVLLAPDEPLPAEFVAEERRRLLSGRQGRIFDVTAWSLPLVYDLDALWTREAPSLALAPLSQDDVQPSPEPARVAYLLPPAGLGWSRSVGHLLDHKVRVRVAGMKMTHDGRELPAGTAVVMVGDNSEKVHEQVLEAGLLAGVKWLPSHTSASEAGIDLGSNKVFPLNAAHVAVVSGGPVSPTSFGAVADLLVNDTGRPFTVLPLARLAKADLSRYGVVILPDGSSAGYRRALAGSGVKALRRFMESGGVLVALKGAAMFCGHKDVKLCRTRGVKAGKGSAGNGDAAGKEDVATPPEQALWRVPGAILRVKLDGEERLAFGQKSEIPVPASGDLLLEAPRRRDVRVVGSLAGEDRLRLAGLVWPEAATRLAGSPWLVREQVGRGAVVLFAGDPNYRGAWDGLRAIFMNALLLEPRP